MSPFRRRAAVLAVAVVVLAGSTTPARGAQHATTGQVKAAFLYNFARFTEWPDDAFASASAALVIGVAGDEALRQALDNVIRARVIGARPIRTRRIADASDADGTHILYVGGTAAGLAPDLVGAVKQRPVLTVGDVDDFCDKGGMINFLISDNRVRFEISVDATERARLKVSSRVLTLAKTLYGKN